MNITKATTLALVCVASLCLATIPGHPQILTCPHCGQTKEIMSLVSGNTFGAVVWSDNKCIAPMLPEISNVQKCPNCKKYFIVSRQKTVYAESGFSAERGLLSFAEVKEAFAQLSQEKFHDNKEEANVRMMLHHAYNDFYFREGKHRDVDKADQALFRENALWLIENFIEDEVMKAEFYREAGDMEKATALIEKVAVDNEFMKKLVATIKEKIKKGETAVFLIEHAE